MTREQAVPLTAEQLEKWLTETVAEAYHGAAGVNPHHDFPECGDPFCTDAQRNLAAILEAYKAGRDGLDVAAGELRAAAAKYVNAKLHFDKKWHQDNCPERGDFQRWYADREKAHKALTATLDALRAALATPSDTPKEPT